MKAVFGAVAFVLAGCAAAQTVYKAPGPSGPLYSDAPLPGGQRIELPPPNVAIPPPRRAIPPPRPTSEPQTAQSFSYRRFRVVEPQDGGSAAAQTANFEVRVEVEPALAPGHAIVLTLDGREVPRRYRSTEMLIPPEFFPEAIEVNRRYRLTARIVDETGRVRAEAPPVDFLMRDVPLPRGRF